MNISELIRFLKEKKKVINIMNGVLENDEVRNKRKKIRWK